jgi:large subunit ribosomal protein L5
MGEYTPRLQQKYQQSVVPQLMKEFQLQNRLEAPRLLKVSVNMGLGIATQNPKIIDSAVVELASICGQKQVVTRAKKSIATFKLRQGSPIGVAVTLRKDRMWEFVDRLFTLALPRVRDFRGLPTKSFDGRGNYTLGIREQIIFSEIDYEKIDKIKGMSITFTTTAGTDERGRALLTHLGLPFRKQV